MPIGVSDFPLRTEGVKGRDEKAVDHQWWTLPETEVHNGITAVADAIEKQDSPRRESNLLHARLYGNRDLLASLRPHVYARTAPGRPGSPAQSRLTFNVAESCTATASALIARSKPKPDFLTDDGDATLQARAKWLTRYVEGVFYEGKVYGIAQRAFVHACVFGTGIVHTYWEPVSKDRHRLAFEWVLPDEVLIDEEEGRYGAPRQLHRRKRVLKERLIALFPDREKEIRSARGDDDTQIFTRLNRPNAIDPDSHVIVTESWHLPSGPEAQDGKHAICIGNCTLLVEPYEADYFPFTFFSWKDPLEGFWGVGLVEDLLPIQLEIMRLCRTIAESQRLACVPRVFIESSTQVVGAHLNDIPGGVVRYVGREPKIGPAPGAAPELYSALNDWIRRAYEQVGVSQLQASSQKPAGINSGVALREYADNASGKFSLTSQRWEEFFMELARKVVDMSRRRFASGDKKLSVKAPFKEHVRTIKWSQVDLDEDSFVMKVFPTNSLPTTPAARKDTIVELLQAGLLPKEQALALLDYPDLKAYTSLATAALEDVRDTIDRILEEGKPGEVDEMTNLQLCVQMGTSAVLRGKHRGVSEDRLELLRRWVDECRIKLQETQAPPAQEGPANDNGSPPGAGQPGEEEQQIPPGLPIEARAAGGPVQAGRPYLVGEQGPELIVPKQDGQVLTNQQSAAVAPEVVPLTNSPQGTLHQTLDGHAFYANPANDTAPMAANGVPHASLSGPARVAQPVRAHQVQTDASGVPITLAQPQLAFGANARAGAHQIWGSHKGSAPAGPRASDHAPRNGAKSPPSSPALTPDQLSVLADAMQSQLRADHEARMSAGPAVHVEKDDDQ